MYFIFSEDGSLLKKQLRNNWTQQKGTTPDETNPRIEVYHAHSDETNLRIEVRQFGWHCGL